MSEFEDQELFSTHPNDAFFKSVFSDTARAAEFFQTHLPASMAAVIDWATLTTMPASFVKRDLQQAHSDLLFTAKSGGRELLLYLLFEHQTTVDPQMPLRLLNYITQILIGHAERHALPLPAVVPFVLHQGPERWTVSPHFEDLFALTEAESDILLPYVPRFRHALLDLTQCDPASDEDHAKMQVILHLMKAARTRKLLEFFKWLGQSGVDVTMLLEGHLFRLCLVYAWNADDTLDVEEISRQLAAQPRLQSEAMTTAQKLRNEGKLEGKLEGEARGQWIGKIVLLRQLMQLPTANTAEMDSLGAGELERRFKELEGEYETKFRR